MGDKINFNSLIVRQLSFIKKNTTNIDDILDVLIEEEVISLSERENLKTHNTSNEQLHKIIEIVSKKNKVDVFVRALEKTGNQHVVDVLKDGDELPRIRGNEMSTQTDYSEVKSEKEVHNLKKEADLLKRDNWFLKSRVGELEQENKDLLQKFDELEKNYDHLRKVQGNLKVKISENQKEKAELKAENNLLVNTKHDNDKKIDEIINENDVMKNNMGVLSRRIDDLQSQNDQLERKVGSITSQFSDHLEECSNINSYKEEIKFEMEKFREDLRSEYKKGIEGLEEKFSSMKTQNEELLQANLNNNKTQTDSQRTIWPLGNLQTSPRPDILSKRTPEAISPRSGHRFSTFGNKTNETSLDAQPTPRNQLRRRQPLYLPKSKTDMPRQSRRF